MAMRAIRSLQLNGIRHASSLRGSGSGQSGGSGIIDKIRHASTNIGDVGSGSGKGGGASGAIRSAGGAFGRMEAANEELYFRRVQALQLKRIREHLEEEVDNHEKTIREHQEAIERHKKKIQKLHQHEKEIMQKTD